MLVRAHDGKNKSRRQHGTAPHKLAKGANGSGKPNPFAPFLRNLREKSQIPQYFPHKTTFFSRFYIFFIDLLLYVCYNFKGITLF